jgi:hypothetical protein
MRTPLRRFIAQILKIAPAGGRPLRQHIWSDAYHSRADLLKTLAQSRPRSYWAGDTFLTVPYRPILARLHCHAWLSVRRPERRRCAQRSFVTANTVRDEYSSPGPQ